MKYKSELIKDIVDTRGHETPLIHYESECVEKWIKEVQGAYPKLCDYQSEWLNYIIENPLGEFPYITLSNVTNATVENVVPYAYKSAILKGQTLVNVDSYYDKTYFNQSNIDSISEDGYIQVSATGGYRNVYTYISSLIKPSTQYLFIIEIKENTLDGSFFILTDGNPSSCFGGSFTQTITSKTTGLFKYKVTTINDLTNCQLCLRNFVESSATSGKIIFRTMLIEYQEGMENLVIPFFRGMQSVKMPVLTTTGKNLFNKNNIIVDGYIISNGNLVYQTGDNRNATDYIEVESNCSYTISGIKNSAINGAKTHQYVGMYDKNKTFISIATIYCLGDKETITTAENTKYIRLSVRNDDINRLQIEKGTTPTTYEPHKSNILTVNEDVTLRSNGDVYDELNLLTGQLTQRIDEDGEVLSQEVIKTVDLSNVDQDGNVLKLKPIEGTMHLKTNGEILKPTFTGEIPVEAITQNLTSFIKLEMEE